MRRGRARASLETIFAENGVAWSDKPLLPIMPSATNPETPAPH